MTKKTAQNNQETNTPSEKEDNNTSKETLFKTHSAGVLTEALREKGWSKKELSQALGVTPGYVSHLTSGVKTMSPQTATRIASTLELNDTQRTNLHRAAALDHGFELNLPDDF